MINPETTERLTAFVPKGTKEKLKKLYKITNESKIVNELIKEKLSTGKTCKK